jgi:hypothetical protein
MNLRVKIVSNINIFLFNFIFLVLFINFDRSAKNNIKKEINIKDYPIYLQFEERTKCISKCPTIPPKSGFIESIVLPYERGECLRLCEQNYINFEDSK